MNSPAEPPERRKQFEAGVPITGGNRGWILVRGLLQPDGGREKELCQPVLGGVCVCVCVSTHGRWQEEKVKILQVLCIFLTQLFSLFNLPIPPKVLPFLRKKEERM